MKVKIVRAIAVLWFVVFFGLVVSRVGDIPGMRSMTTKWDCVWVPLLAVIFPFTLGYFSRK